MFKTTTTCIYPAASTAGLSTTTLLCLDKDGEIKKSGVITSTAMLSTTTSFPTLQEQREKQALLNVHAYIESMSEEELETMLAKLEEKEVEIENNSDIMSQKTKIKA